jgi:hypothetical protein
MMPPFLGKKHCVIFVLVALSLCSIIGNLIFLKKSALLENVDESFGLQPTHIVNALDTASRQGTITLPLYRDPKSNATGTTSAQQQQPSDLDDRLATSTFRQEKNHLRNITLALYKDPRLNETGMVSEQQSGNLDDHLAESTRNITLHPYKDSLLNETSTTSRQQADNLDDRLTRTTLRQEKNHLRNISLHAYKDPLLNDTETGIPFAQQPSNLDDRLGEKTFRPEKNHLRHNEAQRLEFIHIPKSGGTMLEIAAAAATTTWGYCHFEWKVEHCLPATRGKGAVWPKSIALGPHVETQPWHVPPYYFERKELNLPYNPYANATLFTIVRNPFDRVMSEFFYALSITKRGSDNAKLMNQWISRRLEKARNATKRKKHSHSGGHFLPQYDYVFDRSQPNETRRVIDHVIHFEQLHEEFPALLALYNLSQMILPKEKIGKFSHRKPLGVANLTRGTAQLIESVYAKDFEEFGYKMSLSSNSEMVSGGPR